MIKELEAMNRQETVVSQFPSFVFQIGVGNRSKRIGGFANAILLDRDRGIFVTNAHTVNKGSYVRSNEFYIAVQHGHTFVSAPSLEDMLRIKKQWFVSRENRPKLYKDYVRVSVRHSEQNSKKICPGLSGSAVLTQDGKLIGILAHATELGTTALAIPSHEIERMYKLFL